MHILYTRFKKKKTLAKIKINLNPERFFDEEEAAALPWIYPASLIVATD